MNKNDYPKSGPVKLQTTEDLTFVHVQGGNFVILSEFTGKFHFGEHIFPKGTKTSNKTSMGYDNTGEYNFATEYPFDKSDFAYHDAEYRGINIPLEYLEPCDTSVCTKIHK